MVQFGTKLQANKIPKWSTHYVDYSGLKHLIKEIAEEIEAIRRRRYPLMQLRKSSEQLGDDGSGSPHSIDDDRQPTDVSEGEGSGYNSLGEISEKKSLLESSPKNELSSYGSRGKTRAMTVTFASEDIETNRSPRAAAMSVSQGSIKKQSLSLGGIEEEPTGLQSLIESELFDENPDKAFEQKIIDEVQRVQDFYVEKLREFRDRVQLLRSAMLKISRRKLVADVEEEELGDLDREILSVDSAKRAFQDVYRELSFLHNYTILNYTAFVKILKKHDKITGLKTKNHMIKHIHKYKNGFVNATELLNQIQSTEIIVAKAFYNNNLTLARSELLMKHKAVNDWQMLHIGMRIGITSMLAVWVMWDIAMDAWMKPDELQLPLEILRIFRGFGYFVLASWLWCACVYAWNSERVNYIYLFEFDPRYVLTVEELMDRATTISISYLFLILLYLKVSRGEVPGLPSEACRFVPLLMVGYFIALMIFPLNQRQVVLEVLQRVVLAPFYQVTFYSSYVADVLTSMAKPLVDIGYTVCFFASGDWQHMSAAHAAPGVCMSSFTFNRIVTPLIITSPLLFRFMQCLRRYHDTGKRVPHLLNALKYALAFSLVLLGSLHPRYSSSSKNFDYFQLLWIGSFGASTLYTYYWDIYLDWGLGDKSERMLRKVRMFPTDRYYYIAMVVDLFLRFTWCLTLIPHLNDFLGTFGSSYYPMLLGWLELCRRAMWSVFRVEYEHLSNAQGYRRVDYVPLHFETPIHEKTIGAETAKSRFQMLFELTFFAFIVFAVALFAFLTEDQ